MSMRISERLIGAGLSCLALAGCGQQATQGDQGPVADNGDKIECAIGPGTGWVRNCIAERARDILLLRHPDGGFRRFRIVKDGRGLVPADGAEPAKVDIDGDGQIELTVGDDRYRLPATIAQASN